MITWTRSAIAESTAQTEGVVDWDWRSMSGDELTPWTWSTGSQLDADMLKGLFEAPTKPSGENGC